MSSNTSIQLEKLVMQARAGDGQAFEELYNLTYRLVYFHAKALSRDEDEAWDLVQETYLTAYRKLDTLREGRLFPSWLSGIAFRLGHKRLRKKTELLLNEEEAGILEELPEQDTSRLPENALEQKETVRIVQQGIERLPALQKAAVIAYYVDGMSVSEIAGAAQCSEGTIKSRLNYARKALKEYLSQEEKRMGCSLHAVTAPVIVMALHGMFSAMPVSGSRIKAVWEAVAGHAGISFVRAQPEGYDAAVSRSSVLKNGAKAAASAGMKGGAAAGWRLRLLIAGLTLTTAAGAAGAAAVGVHLSEKKEKPAVAGERSQEETTEEMYEEMYDLEQGWISTADGWKYRTANGTFLKGQWEEIEEKLYYFGEDEIMRTGKLCLGSRQFTLADSGELVQVEPVNECAFYEEDKKYYTVADGLYVSGTDGSGARKLCDVPEISGVTAENGVIYFYTFHNLYRINADGSGLNQKEDQSWLYEKNMIACNGSVYLNCTSNAEGDPEIPQGSLIRIDGTLGSDNRNLLDMYGEPEYKQLQESDGWLYFINNNSVPEIFGGERYDNILFRYSLTDQTIERVSEQSADAFFVYGDTAYCMRDGVLVRLCISEQTEKNRDLAEQFRMNPEQVFQNYLDDVLIPRYGRVETLSGQHYYQYEEGMGNSSIRPEEPEDLPMGILDTYIDDLDGDGMKELVVFRIGESDKSPWIKTALKLDGYRMLNGEIVSIGTVEAGAMSLIGDLGEMKLCVKAGQGYQVFGVCGVGANWISADGFTSDIQLIRCDGRYLDIVASDSGGNGEYPVDCDTLREKLRRYGYGFTADHDVYGDDDVFEVWISDQEPDCRTLLRMGVGMGVGKHGYNELPLQVLKQYGQDMIRSGRFTDHPIYWRIELNPEQGNVRQKGPFSDMGSAALLEPEPAEGLSESQKAKAAYKKILEEKQGGEFALLDINQDGVEELLYGDPWLGSLPILYVYQNGEVQQLPVWEGGNPDGISYYPDIQTLIIDKFTQGFYEIEAFFYDAGAWRTEDAFWSHDQWGGRLWEDPQLSYSEFYDMVAQSIDEGLWYWKEEDLEDQKLAEYYQKYIGQRDQMIAFEQKFRTLDDPYGNHSLDSYENNAENRWQLFR